MSVRQLSLPNLIRLRQVLEVLIDHIIEEEPPDNEPVCPCCGRILSDRAILDDIKKSLE